MKKYLNWALMLPVIASLTLVSCQKDEEEIINNPTPPPIDNPVEDLVLVAEGSSDVAMLDIKVYAEEDLFVGYNKLYTVILEKGTFKQIKTATVMYHPLMEMTNHSHACPIEQPKETSPEDGLFEGAAIFTMPSGTMGSWTLTVDLSGMTGYSDVVVDLSIDVMEPVDARLYSFESPVDMKKIFITYVEPSDPEVGMNDFIVAAHYKETMMSFPPVKDLVIEFDPQMPSMGHGSPNNENPVHIMDGHYQGVVNFTMTGWWELNMVIKDENGTVLDDKHSFDVNF